MSGGEADRRTETVACPCLMIAAPSSGSGKTTLTAALARWHRRRGRRVRVFKVGPDYIDPMILEQACDAPVYSLDPGMMTETHWRQLLVRAARDADLILVEGVMGLFDGEFSAADIARQLQMPVVLTVDVRAMAETFAAVVQGLATLDPALHIHGCFANRVASERHGDMIRQAVARYLPASPTLQGMLYRDQAISFPERHLGLTQAGEIQDLEARLERAAEQIDGQAITALPPPVTLSAPVAGQNSGKQLRGKTIAVAKDRAFSFIYAANIDFMRDSGAEIVWTSPLSDRRVPEADCLYLPGGYPELYAAQLQRNSGYIDSVRAYSGTILAECGGMIYLSESLQLLNGERVELCGRLPVHTRMQETLQAVGWQRLTLPEGELLAHSFHYSSATPTEQCPEPVYATARRERVGEAVYQHGRIFASYLHWYFASNPQAACRLLSGQQCL